MLFRSVLRGAACCAREEPLSAAGNGRRRPELGGGRRGSKARGPRAEGSWRQGRRREQGGEGLGHGRERRWRGNGGARPRAGGAVAARCEETSGARGGGGSSAGGLEPLARPVRVRGAGGGAEVWGGGSGLGGVRVCPPPSGLGWFGLGVGWPWWLACPPKTFFFVDLLICKLEKYV